MTIFSSGSVLVMLFISETCSKNHITKLLFYVCVCLLDKTQFIFDLFPPSKWSSSYMWVISEVLCMVAAPYTASYD